MQIVKPSPKNNFLFSALSIPGGIIRNATFQLKHGTFFKNTSVIILAMGTNDVLKNGKNFEKIFEKDLIQQIETCRTMHNKAEVRLWAIVVVDKNSMFISFQK